MKPHIAIIDPAVLSPELETFNRFSAREGYRFSYHLPALFGFSSLDRVEGPVDAVIVLGSNSSVNDRLEWQEPLEAWIRTAMKRKTPILGICYGHQMLAHMFGAKVGFAFSDHEKFVGFREVELQENRMGVAPTREPLFFSHCEMVLNCPSNFRVIAKSDKVKVEGLEHATLPVWSFQAHPEAQRSFADDRGANVPVSQEADFRFGSRILQGFLDMVRVADRKS